MTTLRRTTVRKIVTSGIIVGGIIAGTFVLYVFTILLWEQPKNLNDQDAIIVLTGSRGRIETGFNLLLNNAAPQLFISGVERNATLADLVNANNIGLTESQSDILRNHCCIVLDYEAYTTATNATEAAKWIADNNFQNIILVTSAPHMPRSYFQFHMTMDDTVKITPYPYIEGRKLSLVTDPSFWHDAVREYIKFAGSLVRLKQ